jgi:hypothetical protein
MREELQNRLGGLPGKSLPEEQQESFLPGEQLAGSLQEELGQQVKSPLGDCSYLQEYRFEGCCLLLVILRESSRQEYRVRKCLPGEHPQGKKQEELIHKCR